MRTTYIRAGYVHVIHKGKFFGEKTELTSFKPGSKIEVSDPSSDGRVTVTFEGSSEHWSSIELPRRQKKNKTNDQQQAA